MSSIRRIGRKLPIVFLCIICLAYSIIVFRYIALAQLMEPAPQNMSAPADHSADFVVFGDSQGNFGLHWPVGPAFEDMIPLVNQIDASMAFHVGDMYVGDDILSMDVEEQVDRFLDDMADLEMPWYPVMGNHDAAGEGWEITREDIFGGGSTYHSFDTDDSHFIVLDAFMPGEAYSISPVQMAWLRYDLSRNTQPHVFVFVHAPLYPIGPHVGSSLDKDIELRDRLAALLVEYGVDVVFTGHEHYYASFEYDGLMQVITGGAGAKLRTPDTFKELIGEDGYEVDKITRLKAIRTLHYVTVATSEHDIRVSAYDYEGTLIDYFVIPSQA